MAQAKQSKIFTAPFRTKKGNIIQVPLPGFPKDEPLRATITDIQHRPPWAQEYVAAAYREWRADDNHRRTDVTIDIGETGADYFASTDIPVAEQVESTLFTVELLAPLTRRQREFIELHFIDGHTHAQIAELKNATGEELTSEAVRKTIARALAQLRKKNPDLAQSGFTTSHA